MGRLTIATAVRAAGTATLVALALGGCGLADDGTRTAQVRTVPAFARIENDSSVDLRLHVGARRRVRVLAGEKVIDDVSTQVQDGTLRVSFDHHGFGGKDVVVEASTPTLQGVVVSGSGSIDADGIDEDTLTVRLNGSADLALTGTTRRLDLELDGSGDADLSGLTARRARVTARGSGDLDVRADERLAVDLSGSGDVRYHGRPALTPHITGSGDLRGSG
jgi:Putative auto-transporter adhesin, head GIN domain